MKKVKFRLILGLFVMSLFVMNSCSNDDNGYSGVNEAYIKTEGTKTLTIGEEAQRISVKLTLTRKVDKATTLRLKATNKSDSNNQIVKIEPENVVIKQGEREASFKVELADNISLIKEQEVEISIETQGLITPKENLVVVIKPALNISELSAEQKQLLIGYKAKGMDIAPFLGKQKVKTTITTAKDGALKGFEKEKTTVVEGITVITLAENSTADRPILEMTENPMGMTEFFYFLMKKETIENDEYWYGENAGPNYPKVMQLINWNKTSNEKFSAVLKNITIEAPKGNISNIAYIGEGKDAYGNTINIVPFEFSYTAWDRLKKLVEAGNKEAVEYNNTGASSNPRLFINNSKIDSDDYESGAYRNTTGSIDYNTGKMTFDFITSHTNGGDYIIVKAEYSIK